MSRIKRYYADPINMYGSALEHYKMKPIVIRSRDIKKELRWFHKYEFIIIISFFYGVWFDFADSIPDIGLAFVNPFFGNYYQVWNYIGHGLAGSFWVFVDHRNWRFWAAAILISTVVMDSPLWGLIREFDVNGHDFWCDPDPIIPFNYRKHCTFTEWFHFYYNWVGNYSVLGKESTYHPSGTTIFIPSASIIFWSLAGRGVLAWWFIRSAYKQKGRNIFGMSFDIFQAEGKL